MSHVISSGGIVWVGSWITACRFAVISRGRCTYFFFLFWGRKLTCPSMPILSATRKTDKANIDKLDAWSVPVPPHQVCSSPPATPHPVSNVKGIREGPCAGTGKVWLCRGWLGPFSGAGTHKANQASCPSKQITPAHIAARVLAAARDRMRRDWLLVGSDIRLRAGVLSHWLRGRQPAMTQEQFQQRWCHGDALCSLPEDMQEPPIIHWTAMHPVPLPQ